MAKRIIKGVENMRRNIITFEQLPREAYNKLTVETCWLYRTFKNINGKYIGIDLFDA